MPLELTIKFRNDLLLNKSLPNIDRFVVPPDYWEQADQYHTLANGKPRRLDQQAQTKADKLLLDAWRKFIDWLTVHSFLKPTYLFSHTPTDLVNRLWQKLPNAADDPLPNFYNYFTILLPDGSTPDKWLTLLDELEHFLPHRSAVPLLEYAYLKPEPVALAAVRPSEVTHGNQQYFTTMNLTSIPPNGQGKSVNLTILELDSWYLGHEQFKNTGPTPQPIFPLNFRQENYSLTTPDGAVQLAQHGTKVMGILKARPGDDKEEGFDRCRGIVPQVQIRLASCLVELGLTEADERGWREPENRRYNDPNALLAAVEASFFGDVILIEVGSGEFPLEIQPAVFELLRVAYRRETIVVEAAGNGRTYIGGPARWNPGQPLPNRHLRLRSAITNELTHQQADDRIYWSEYNYIKERIKSLWDDPTMGQNFTSPEAFAQHYVENYSGAILVGAATGSPAQRHEMSSWGKRVGVYAQGVNLLTTTYALPADNSDQYETFGETSGAAAIIAGFVVSLQSIAKANGKRITPGKMAELLTSGQSVILSGNPAGIIPDYKQALTRLNRFLRGTATDRGGQ